MAGSLVVMGASLQCSFGTAPSTFVALPSNMTSVTGMSGGTIMDNVPLLNIMPFAMCTSLANPTVASATAAALGVLTPMPCIPVTTAPWTPGSTKTTLTKKPALTNNDKCFCSWGGVISVVSPGQVKATV